MKRYIVVCLAIAVFIGVAFVYKSYVTTSTIVIISPQAPFYDRETNEELGILHAGEKYNIAAVCETWCDVTIGGVEAKVAASHVEVSDKKKVPNRAKAQKGENILLQQHHIVYTEPTEQSEKLVSFRAGQTIFVEPYNEKWGIVNVLGRQGYISVQETVHIEKYISEKLVQAPQAVTVYQDKALTQPLMMIAANTPFTYIEEQPQFYIVEVGESKGYLKKEGVVAAEPTTLSMSGAATTAYIVAPQQIEVYQTDLFSEPFATLSEQFRYPVLAITEKAYVLQLGGQLAYVKKDEAQIDRGLAAVVYHHILPEEDLGDYLNASSTVTEQAFNEQMNYLARHNFKVLTTDEVLGYMDGTQILPAKAVLLTFDDGLLSTKEYAYPVLKQHKFTALQHIISARKDRTTGIQTFDADALLQFFTDEEMKQMADVFRYEAHTFNMHNLNPVTKEGQILTASAGEFRDDLRQNLEDVEGAVSFAYPFGQYTPQTIEILKELGIELAFTTLSGYTSINESRYEIKRFTPTQQMTLEEFGEYVNGQH